MCGKALETTQFSRGTAHEIHSRDAAGGIVFHDP